MSQAKVDKYKESKKNRQQIMKKEKMERTMWKIGGSLVGLLMVGWIGFSVYTTIDSKTEKPIVSETYEVNADALTDYLSQVGSEDAE